MLTPGSEVPSDIIPEAAFRTIYDAECGTQGRHMQNKCPVHSTIFLAPLIDHLQFPWKLAGS